MRKPMHSLVLIGVMLASTACSVEEPLPPRDSSSNQAVTSSRTGTLLAEFEMAAAEGAASGRSEALQVHAQFLDAQNVPADRALDALEVWTRDGALDRDSCSLESGRTFDAETRRNRDMRLRLLNVGPITVQGPTDHLKLKARRLPDLSSAFSGVIYGTDERRMRRQASGPMLNYEPGIRYSFEAPGKGDMGGFRVELKAPAPIRLLSPAMDAVDSGMTLRWTGESSRRGDVFVDLRSGYGSDRVRLRCRLEDDGHFAIPADLLEQVTEGRPHLDVTARRVTSKPVDIQGLEASNFTLSTVDRRRVDLPVR